MTLILKRDFYIAVACINRESAIWLHEGVIRGSSRDAPISDDARSRFCGKIRELLNDIENTDAPPVAVMGDKGT